MNRIKANFNLNCKLFHTYFLGLLICSLPIILLALFTLPVRGIHYNNPASENIKNNFLINNPQSSFSVTSATAATYVGLILLIMMVFIIIFSLSSSKEILTYSIRLGSSRRDYFIGSLTFYALISGIFSLVYTALFIFENLLLRHSGITQINNYDFMFTKITIPAMIRLTLYTFLMLLTTAALFTLLSNTFYMFGQYTWIFIVILIFFIFKMFPLIISILPTVKHTDFNVNIIDLAISTICFAVSYIIVSKITIKNV